MEHPEMGTNISRNFAGALSRDWGKDFRILIQTRRDGGSMSKIYKALEKAERERELVKDLSHEWNTNELAVERHEKLPEPKKKMNGMVFGERMVSLSQPSSLAAEQFRKLRTYLLRLKILEPIKTIMVTSATDSEGKSFVATNLAISIARDLQSNALLLDCDLRNPTLSKWLGFHDGKGLSDYLKGNGNLSGLLMKTEVEKLNVVTAGTIQDNPTELLGSRKMEALVHELKSNYNDWYMIFDSTPLLATAESGVLAKIVDGIIVVVKAGQTSRETVKQAITSLEKEKILGFVLNHLEFKSSSLSSRYFGSSGYYYKYGYGAGSQRPKGHWEKLFEIVRKK
jgi:exopolysaccharide/PEP-CTERM locus tyrosine autokinase